MDAYPGFCADPVPEKVWERKVIQISTSFTDSISPRGTTLIALCDDGSLHKCVINVFGPSEWEEIPRP